MKYIIIAISILLIITGVYWIYLIYSPDEKKNSKRQKTISAIFSLISVFTGIISCAAMFIPKPQVDGYLKLYFYNGNFQYKNKIDTRYINDNDIIKESQSSYIKERINPIVYITILNYNGQKTEYKSEYVSECLIPINYGDYYIKISSDDYQEYNIELSLNAINKKANLWEQSIPLTSNMITSNNIKVKLVDTENVPLKLHNVFIGYSGYTISSSTDEFGYINELFTLTKGEYLVGLEGCEGTRFNINEENYNNEEITVMITDCAVVEKIRLKP